MSKTQQPRKGNQPHKGGQLRKEAPLHSARMLGIGAVIVSTLASCGNNSVPAPAATRAESTAAVTLAPEPSASPLPATAESIQVATPTTPITEPTMTAIPPTETPASTGRFKDGEYVGDAVRADRWGDLQVRATVQGGQLVKIDIVTYPHSTRRSDLISRAALPTLVSEAIQNQDAKVDVVSRATDTSYAFVASLESALSNAAVNNS